MKTNMKTMILSQKERAGHLESRLAPRAMRHAQLTLSENLSLISACFSLFQLSPFLSATMTGQIGK
jgi:hypothetical protein